MFEGWVVQALEVSRNVPHEAGKEKGHPVTNG